MNRTPPGRDKFSLKILLGNRPLMGDPQNNLISENSKRAIICISRYVAVQIGFKDFLITCSSTGAAFCAALQKPRSAMLRANRFRTRSSGSLPHKTLRFQLIL